MQQLFSLFYRQLEYVSLDFVRYLYFEIRWDNRLIAITGARGVGKNNHVIAIHKIKF